MTAPIDHQRLLAEIDAEVQRKRDSGELPPDLERELDLVFARYAPVHVLAADFERVVERAEQLTFIDPLAPVESGTPGVGFVKRVLRKLVLWMLRFITQQVSGFAEVVVRAISLLGRRVDAIEQVLPILTPPLPSMAAASIPDAGHWSAELPGLIGAVSGRVLVAESRDGSLVVALDQAGIDVYGVEPAPTGSAVEVRAERALDHLRSVRDGALGGVVLAGCTDDLALAGKAQLVAESLRALRAGGTLAVIGRDPRVWASQVGPIRADLAAGRPLSAQTWAQLVTERGCTVGSITAAPRPAGLDPVPGIDSALAEHLRRLDEAVFPAPSFAVVATVANR